MSGLVNADFSSLSPEWTLDEKESSSLPNDAEKEPTKKRKKDSAALMDKGFDIKANSLFSEDLDASEASRHLSILSESGIHMAPSVTEASTVLSDAEVAAKVGMKWQPCKWLLKE